MSSALTSLTHCLIPSLTPLYVDTENYYEMLELGRVLGMNVFDFECNPIIWATERGMSVL